MPKGTAEQPLLAERYRITRRLGTGGMAAVYLAHDTRLDRPVAIKRLHGAGGDDGDDMDARRFEREAKIGASLSHPNLVSIFDIEQDADSVLLVMEYVEGETLADLMSREPVEPARVFEIVSAIAQALDHAHASGIVHRDIKPGNVLLGKDGSVKLADLGIAKAIERTDITGTGTVLGTPAYMAPEQLEGGKLGPAVDIYALAVMAYELLTGKRARRGRTPVEIAHQVVNEPPPDPRDHSPGVSPAAARAIQAGMARNPGDRPKRASDLAEELRPQRGRTGVISATLIQPGGRPRPASPRGRGRLLAVGGLFAVALAAFVISLTSGGGDEPGKDAEKAGQPGPKAAAGPQPKDEQEAQPQPEEPAGEEPPPTAPGGEGSLEEAYALQAQGYEALQTGDYKTAVKLSRTSVEAFPPGTTDPQYAYALFNLGQALRLSGKPEEAIPVLEQRLQIPNQTETVQRELDAARREAGQ